MDTMKRLMANAPTPGIGAARLTPDLGLAPATVEALSYD
jgi:hypothetical protein